MGLRTVRCCGAKDMLAENVQGLSEGVRSGRATSIPTSSVQHWGHGVDEGLQRGINKTRAAQVTNAMDRYRSILVVILGEKLRRLGGPRMALWGLGSPRY